MSRTQRFSCKDDKLLARILCQNGRVDYWWCPRQDVFIGKHCIKIEKPHPGAILEVLDELVACDLGDIRTRASVLVQHGYGIHTHRPARGEPACHQGSEEQNGRSDRESRRIGRADAEQES